MSAETSDAVGDLRNHMEADHLPNVPDVGADALETAHARAHAAEVFRFRHTHGDAPPSYGRGRWRLRVVAGADKVVWEQRFRTRRAARREGRALVTPPLNRAVVEKA